MLNGSVSSNAVEYPAVGDYIVVMPERCRLIRRVAAELRSPRASPAPCSGYDGAYRASQWIEVLDSR